MYGESQKLDLFRRYGVDRIFELRILSVDSEFRGQGVARKLIDMSQSLAIKNGFKVINLFSTFISIITLTINNMYSNFYFQAAQRRSNGTFLPKDLGRQPVPDHQRSSLRLQTQSRWFTYVSCRTASRKSLHNDQGNCEAPVKR